MWKVQTVNAKPTANKAEGVIEMDNEININVNLSNLDEYTKKINDFTQAIEKANSVLKELTNSECKIILEIKN